MSVPRPHTDETRIEDGKWRGVCACGWEAEVVHGSVIEGARMAHRDYRDHVESELGEMAYYEAGVECINCGYVGTANLLVGTDVWAGTCGLCGASGRLRPNNDGMDKERERDKAWRL